MESKKDLNRIKVMLAEKKKTNKWLASALGVNALQLVNGVQTLHSHHLKH